MKISWYPVSPVIEDHFADRLAASADAPTVETTTVLERERGGKAHSHRATSLLLDDADPFGRPVGEDSLSGDGRLIDRAPGPAVVGCTAMIAEHVVLAVRDGHWGLCRPAAG